MTHQVPLFFTGWISTHDSALFLGLRTGQSGELLLVVVKLVDHIHHTRSNASSRYCATATTRWCHPHELSLTRLPIAVLKRECVQLEDLGRSRLVLIYAELYTVQRAIEQALEYLILRKKLACCQANEDPRSPTSHASSLSTPSVLPGARIMRGWSCCANAVARCAIS